MTGNGGPWGSGGGSGGDDQNGGKDRRGTGRKPGDGPQIPEIDALMKKGQEQLRVLRGGGNGGGRSPPPVVVATPQARFSPVRGWCSGQSVLRCSGPTCRSTPSSPKKNLSNCSWVSFPPLASRA